MSRRYLLPEGLKSVAPYFRAMGVGLDMEGKRIQHTLLSAEVRRALKAFVDYKNKALVKLQKDIDLNARYNSQYRGLQKNGSAAWAVLAAKEMGGNAGRTYVGTFDDEATAAHEWDKAMVGLNGLACAWKLNLPQHKDTLKLLNAALKADIGKILGWGGRGVIGQLKCTKYHGVYQVLSAEDCIDLTSSSSSSSSSSTSSSSKRSHAKVIGVTKPLPAEGAIWLPGQAAPFAAMARIGGKAVILGKYSSAVEAAWCYDEFADVVNLPMNGIEYILVRKARETLASAAQVAVAKIAKEREWRLGGQRSKSKSSSAEYSEINNIKMKSVAVDQLNEFKNSAKALKKSEKQVEQLQKKNAKLKEAMDKMKQTQNEKKNKQKEKKKQQSKPKIAPAKKNIKKVKATKKKKTVGLPV